MSGPFEDIGTWMCSAEARGLPHASFYGALGPRLQAAGVPVDRILGGFGTRHPEVRIVGAMWDVRGTVFQREMSHAEYEQDMLQPGPFRDVLTGEPLRRYRLDSPPPYPLLERLQRDGFTDYVAVRLEPFGGPVSFATRADGGFTDASLDLLRRLAPILSTVTELRANEHALDALLGVYLGQDAARRVLAGHVRRGDGETISAAVWFCDMRGFTELSDATPPREVARVLDAVFDGVGAAIDANGGHILKFIGDAVLAVFPLADDGARAAHNALASAEAALAAVARITSDHPVRIGVALHVGDVFYGNVGAPRRLDFTVIGATVNEVCRLEAMCKPLGRALVCSDAFARLAGPERFDSLGAHALKGVSRPVTIFAPRAEEPRA